MVGSSAPQLNVRYPFKPGRSLRGRTAREMLAVKFTEIPDKASLKKPGTLTRQADKVAVQLATQDGASSVQFSGTRRVHRTDSAVDDYVIVFAHGKMWLERTADYFYGVRPVDAAKSGKPPPEYPQLEQDDDVMRDPDSWMPECDSPVTPEEDSGRGTPVQAKRTMISGGRLNGLGSSALGGGASGNEAGGNGARGNGVGGNGVAQKTIGMKTVAAKGLNRGNGGNARRRPEESDEGSDVSSSEEDSDSDSDDSGDDSDSGGEYTDRSSDED